MTDCDFKVAQIFLAIQQQYHQEALVELQFAYLLGFQEILYSTDILFLIHNTMKNIYNLEN